MRQLCTHSPWSVCLRDSSVPRRGILAGGSALLSGTLSGCSDLLQTVVPRVIVENTTDRSRDVSVTITAENRTAFSSSATVQGETSRSWDEDVFEAGTVYTAQVSVEDRSVRREWQSRTDDQLFAAEITGTGIDIRVQELEE
jgi:hypothetical protein